MGEQTIRDEEHMTFGLYQDNELFWQMLKNGLTDVTAVYAHWTVAEGVDIGWAFQKTDNDPVVLYEFVTREPVDYTKGRYIYREKTLSPTEFSDHINRPLFSKGATYDLKAMLGNYDPAKPCVIDTGLF